MKKILFYIILSFGFMITACTDPCKDTICNFGVCVEGDCECDPGYTGATCETEQREKFLGDWKSIDFSCDGINAIEFNITLGKGGVSEGVKGIVWIDNDQLDDRFLGVLENDVITFKDQMIDGTDDIINATFTLNNETLEIAYSYFEENQNTTWNCTATATKL